MLPWVLAIVVALAILGGGLLLFTPLGERPLSALFSVGEAETIDFSTLVLSDKPNQFLICPAGFCGAGPHAESPTFEITVGALRARWDAVLAAQPRVTLLRQDTEGLQMDYVQRSAWFRYPDLVTVRFIALSDSQSTLAVYSRSIYGRGDFGVNQARVEGWLALLNQTR